MKHLFLFFLIAALPGVALAKSTGQETGLPTPRFVSLKAEEINMRKGPGTRYPIEWVYRRKHLPVEIMEEFGHWRRVRDSEGTSGWLHKQMVSGARYVLISGEAPVTLLEDPEEGSPPTARMEPGVVAGLLECQKHWCFVEAYDVEGWVKKTNMYGAYDKELYNQ